MRILSTIIAVALTASGQPLLPTSVSRPVPTHGSVLLSWDYGIPFSNYISNVTTRATTQPGMFNNYLVSGLPIGSTNVFVAVNDSGISNVATGVAQPFVLSSSIRIHSYLVTVPTSTNNVTRILTSTNLRVWTTFRRITNFGPTYQFVWTNDSGPRFFHSVSP